MERLLSLNRKADQEAPAAAERRRTRPKRPPRRASSRKAAPRDGEASEPGVRPVPLDRLRPNPEQPRQVADDEALEELTDSIRAQGVIQPLLVRPHPEGDGVYEIVVGERRYTAARRAGLEAVPCIVRALDDRQTFLVSVAENVAREDLNPIDEAAAYRRVLDEGYAANQGEIADLIGIHRTRVSRKLKLLSLDPRIQAHLRSAPDEALSLTHLEELTRLEPGDTQHELYRAAVARGLSTRELHARVDAQLAPRPRRNPSVSRSVVALDSGARITVYPTHINLRIPRQAGDEVGLARIASDLEGILAELRSRLDG
ncbi:MAG: ParB/RepB/Spo0J family partition protein [Planctomycetota bacterium]